MRIISRFPLLAVCALAAAGCHSNDAPDAAPPNAASNTPTIPAPTTSNQQPPTHKPLAELDTRPILVCFGDSLTAGYGTEPGESYPDYLQTALNDLHYHYRVDNQGISGNTTKDGVERIPNVLMMHPTVVIVEFGGNDGLRGLPIADTRANLDKIVATLKDSGTQVVLAGITLPPDYGPDYIDQFNETYQLLAKKYHVPMLPFLLKNVYGVPGMMQEDRTHATSKGNQIVARNVLPMVLPLLKK
jgi:acyl-CoA thioesterase I